MEISFENKQLRQLCESENRAKRLLGPTLAAKLKSRLADLQAFTNVNDLIVGQVGTANAKGDRITVKIGDTYKLVFCANHNTLPVLEDGNIDWSKVTRIKILRIGENDGS